MRYRPSSGAGPWNWVVTPPLPIAQAWNDVPDPRAPSMRSIQPVRSEEPGAAFSISSIASKCERVGLT